MDTLRWQEYFERNRTSRVEPDWERPCPEPARVQRALGRSLAHFQLGESGDGKTLLELARAAGQPRYHDALALFVAEENEHARLLARLTDRYGGRPVVRHWTHSWFRALRHAGGLELELSVLVCAELVGNAYYRLLAQKTVDPVLRDACALILRDEAQHVRFHIDHLRLRHADWLPLARELWTVRLQIMLMAAAWVAWLDHGACLRALGAARSEFFREVRREGVAFLAGLAAPQLAAAPGPVAAIPPGSS